MRQGYHFLKEALLTENTIEKYIHYQNKYRRWL